MFRLQAFQDLNRYVILLNAYVHALRTALVFRLFCWFADWSSISQTICSL